MANLDTIFDNIDQYTDNIDDLVQALRMAGITNYEEFIDAAHTAGVPVKKAIRDEVAIRFTQSEEVDWANAMAANTEAAFQHYLNSYPEGQYRALARNRIEDLQRQAAIGCSEDEWASVDKRDINALQYFVDRFPESIHYNEAANLLRELRREQYLGVDIKALERQIKAIRTDKRIIDPERAIYDKIVNYIETDKITVEDLLSAIAEDNNFVSGSVANMLWENGYITDFSRAGISSDFIAHMMSNIKLQEFPVPEPMYRITKAPCTEVYFWGIPSSGKTCALGAILSSANSGRVAVSMQRDPNCQGYGYMTRLANLFKSNGSIGTLPEGTATTSTYEMGFVLEDEKGKVHPITCVDLAGELIRCMYKLDAGEPLTEEEQRVLRTLTSILIDNRTDNRKMHFFVIEYGAEDRLYEGLSQADYLDAAVAYIQRTGIFRKDTDGIYLLITKVDKAKATGPELQEKLRNYISENYRNFYNVLKKICKDNEINGGVVNIQPFTLGTVCFQNYCKFQDQTAASVVKRIMERSYGYKANKLNSLINKFKN